MATIQLWITLLVFPLVFGHRHTLNIAHRGSAGVLPEHTKEGYILAIEQGADYIECDVVLTKDLVPVCRHEALLNFTTDVTNRVEFRDKINTHDGTIGWFTVDFTLEELKRLHTVQHFDFRDQSHNGEFEIATLEEYIEIAKQHNVGIYPEIKDPEFFNSLDIMPDGVRFEDIVIDVLTRHGYTGPDRPCFVQSFSEESLLYIRNDLESDLKLIILFWKEEYAEAEDLDRYAANGFSGVGCWKDQVVKHYNSENLYKNWIWDERDFVQECHSRGLIVHVYTFSNEDRFLAWDYSQDPYNEYAYFLNNDVDGMFTDFPATLNRILMWRKAEPCSGAANQLLTTWPFLFFLYFLTKMF